MKLKVKVKAQGTPGEVTSAIKPSFKKVADMMANSPSNQSYSNSNNSPVGLKKPKLKIKGMNK